jgi:hypothetical protein
MLVALQQDGDADLQLLCCVCRQSFRTLSEAYIGHVAPTNGHPLETRWGHKKCFDGHLAQVFGSTHVRIYRGDLAFKTMLQRWRSYEQYKMYT